MSRGPSRIRRPTPGDLDAVVALLNACDVAELGSADTAPEDVAGDWQLEGFDLGGDAWLAVTDGGGVTGYAYAGDQLRNGELEADYWVLPQHEEPALAGRLLTLAERRARELARTRGYGEAATLTIHCFAADHAKRGLLRERGFQLTGSVLRLAAALVAPAAPAAPPAGIVIRPLQGADAVVVHALLKDACDGCGTHTDAAFAAWQARLESHGEDDAGLRLVAWRDAEAVGVVVVHDHTDLAWVTGLAVRADARRRGIGTALLTHAFSELAQRGRQHVELAVELGGEAQLSSLYRHAGLHVAFAYERYAKRLVAPAI